MNLATRPELRIVACLVAAGLSAHALWQYTPGLVRGPTPAGVVGHAAAEGLITLFGRAAWLIPMALLEFARRTLCRRDLPLVALSALLSLACTTLGLATAGAGGQVGRLIAEGLLQLFGAGAYLICSATLLFAALYCAPSDMIPRLARRVTARFAAAWNAATALERADHAARTARASSRSLRHLSLLPRVPAADSPARAERVVESASLSSTDPGEFRDVVELVAKPPAPPPLPAPASTEPSQGEVPNPLSEPVSAEAALAGAPLAEPIYAWVDDASSSAEGFGARFELPTPALLAAPPLAAAHVDEERLKKHAKLLEEKLAGFGVVGRVDGIHPGPVVTLYEYEPQGGTKLSKIAGLGDDLSMALQTKVRVVAPIPGTARVGFEVPNDSEHRELVCLRELLEDERWNELQADLPVVLGKNIGGQPVYADLAKMPHMLIAGATGSGKSVGLNALLVSLLVKLPPQELRLLLIDPKAVELAAFEAIPHLLLPVVTEPKRATRALCWACQEMDRRYSLFVQAGARNLHGFNARVSKQHGSAAVNPNPASTAPLPRILVVVDEFADLMMLASKDAEEALARLAHKGRASGIHVIVATQRPSVDVITGTIKANFLARIAYQVAQREDSKTILGRTGAQHLLGLGDMLCQLPGALDLQRVHGAHVGEDEVKNLCDHLRAQGAPVYDTGVLQASDEEPPPSAQHGGSMREAEYDELYDRAVRLVAQERSCSVSALQRGLNVGYNRAAKLVARMAAEGVVGPPSPRAGGRRDVFVEANCVFR